jgi:hypothetical protein
MTKTSTTKDQLPVGTIVTRGSATLQFVVVAVATSQVQIKRVDTTNKNTSGGWYYPHQLTLA